MREELCVRAASMSGLPTWISRCPLLNERGSDNDRCQLRVVLPDCFKQRRNRVFGGNNVAFFPE